MEAVLKDGATTVYCIDAEDDFCSGLEQNGLRIIRGSLGYRYAQALVRNLAHPPHECDVIVYNLCNPACYDASSWGPGLNDNYHCEVVKLERDKDNPFHYKGTKRVYSKYRLVSETQIGRGGFKTASSFDGADILRAVAHGGTPLVYFLNPTFLTHVSSCLPLWLQMAVDVSPTVSNEFDLPDFSDRFSQSLSRIGRDNLDFQRPIKFRIDKVAARDNASKIILINLALNRVGDTLAALISYGRGYIFFLPPFQNDISGCLDLVKYVIPRFQEDLKKSAELNRAEMIDNTAAAVPSATIQPETWNAERLTEYLKEIDNCIASVNYERAVSLSYTCLEGFYKAFVRQKLPEKSELNELIDLSREIKKYLSVAIAEYPEEALNMINHISYTVDRARNRFSESHFEAEAASWLATFVRDLVNTQIRLLLHFMRS